ncbi:MAG: hypothetical protein ACQCN3_02600 [Candidatus Bathyarchaeia archaeon]|jgi:hypothetical protein
MVQRRKAKVTASQEEARLENNCSIILNQIDTLSNLNLPARNRLELIQKYLESLSAMEFA